jgi:hypothetical protein
MTVHSITTVPGLFPLFCKRRSTDDVTSTGANPIHTRCTVSHAVQYYALHPLKRTHVLQNQKQQLKLLGTRPHGPQINKHTQRTTTTLTLT